MALVPGEKVFERVPLIFDEMDTLLTGIRPGEDDPDVIIAREPRILEQLRRFCFEERIDGVAQPVKRIAQRLAPLLMPAHTGIAAAIGVPAFDPVRTAPGGALDDLRLDLR